MPRVFIAITTPAVLQQTLLQEIRTTFQHLPLPFRWVHPSHLHVTLKFLGEVPESLLPTLHQAMQRAAIGQKSFTLVAHALGCFPHPSRPRILWLGLDDPQRALLPLYQRMELTLMARGFPTDERPFHPHVTLARIRKPVRCEAFPPLLAKHDDRRFGDIPVRALHLFQSQLSPAGAMHTMLHSVPLQR